MSTCTATANPREGVTLRCDRQAGHEAQEGGALKVSGVHYDFHQDAEWIQWADDQVTIHYRTVTR